MSITVSTSLESFSLNKIGKCYKKLLPILPNFANQTNVSIIEDLDIKNIDRFDIVAKTIISVWMDREAPTERWDALF